MVAEVFAKSQQSQATKMVTIAHAPPVIEKMEAILKFEHIYNMPSADKNKGGGGGLPPTGVDDWGGGGGPNPRTLTYDQKYAIKGRYAIGCMQFNFGKWYVETFKDEPYNEIWALRKVREYLDYIPYLKPAFDLHTRRIYFYCSKDQFRIMCE